MQTIEQAFNNIQSRIDALYVDVEGALLEFCQKSDFLLVGRKKDAESLRDKIETGRYASIKEIDDIVAFSIVIDTRNQEKKVISFLKKSFQVQKVRSRTAISDERSFDFDCTRIYCKIHDKAKIKLEISEWYFEVQVRTILQHAWSKITHPHVYKAHLFDPRKARLAAELMAQLESADRAFSNFKSSSRSVKKIVRKDVESCGNILNLIDGLISQEIIPRELRPRNGRRLAENIYNSIYDRRKNMAQATACIDSFFRSMDGKFPMSVSLYQIAVIALYDKSLLDIRKTHKGRHYHISDELINLFPQAKNINRRVDIDL